jgi:hypothetical protein
MKGIMYGRISEKNSLNVPYEGNRRQTVDTTHFHLFISNCLKELKSKGSCLCFSQEQVNTIREYACITYSINQYKEFTVTLCDIPSVKINRYIYPQTTPIKDLPKGEVIQYLIAGEVLRYE